MDPRGDPCGPMWTVLHRGDQAFEAVSSRLTMQHEHLGVDHTSL